MKQLASQIKIKAFRRELKGNPQTAPYDLSKAYASLGSSFLERCATANTAAFRKNVQIARVKLASALKFNSTNAYAHYLWAISLVWSSDRASKRVRLRLLKLAESRYRQAVKADPNYFQAYNNLGNVLANQAKLMNIDNAIKLYDDAEVQFQSALKANPKHAEALYNWSICLLNRSYLSPTDDADRYYAEAKKKCDAAIELRPNMYRAFEVWAYASTERAKINPVGERERHLDEAEKYVESALRLRSDFEKAHFTLARIHAMRATMSGSVDESSLIKAEKEFEAAVKIKREYPEALVDWAYSLITRASVAEDAVARNLLRKAKGKLETALRLNSECSDALFVFGILLEAKAKRATSMLSVRYIDKAIGYYKQATVVNPNDYGAQKRWADVLLERSYKAGRKQKAKLLREAAEKYDRQLAHIRHDADVWYRSGHTLFSLAALSENKNSGLQEARVRFEKAVELSPDHCDARAMLGNTLIELGKSSPAGQKKLYGEAEDELLKAEQFRKGSASFYLGCLCALTNRNDECRRWLFKSVEHGQVAKEAFHEEKDLGAVRSLPWFDDLLSRLSTDRCLSG